MARPLILLLPALAAALPAVAGELHVPSDQPTIAAALARARVGDEVILASGTYTETLLLMRPGVTLRSASGDPADVILDGQGAGPILFCNDIEERIAVRGLTFRNGAGAGGGAVDLRLRRGVDITDCVFENNSSASQGGALSVVQVHDMDTENCIFRNLVFRDNTAALDGGAAYVLFAPVLFQGCEFRDNSSGRDGGGLFVPSLNTVILQCDFTGNRADADGGAFDGNGRCRISESTFIGNHADQSGGAVQIVENVSDCRFVGNTCGGAGGAVLLADETSRTEYIDNHAGLFGGAIGGLGVGRDCLFEGNTAGYAGGAVSGPRQLARCVFRGNSAPQGGALEVNSGPNAYLDCEFENNSALLEGGAIYAWGFVMTTEVVNCGFRGNTAPSGPDGVYPDAFTCVLECSGTDPSLWVGGDLVVDDSACQVANEAMTFSDLKRSYR